MTLLDDVASIANLSEALAHCRKGKRRSQGYQKFLLHMPEALFNIRDQLLSQTYKWRAYRSFFVCDPKRREVLAACFRDRIVHQALCQKIAPLIEQVMLPSSFACRKGKGNRRAVLELLGKLRDFGPKRTVIKLDVKHYFASINHDILLSMLNKLLPDTSLEIILRSLLNSHPEYGAQGKGIPIGNVTSQHFANLYLAPVDRFAAPPSPIYYVRYMDDMVVMGANASLVYDCVHGILEMIGKLKLEIPFHKRVPLGHDPIPFLGFVVDHLGYRPLARNKRRVRRKLKRMSQRGVRLSQQAVVETSYSAWCDLGVENSQVTP